MPEHAVYCIDHPSAGDLAIADHADGWLLSSRRIDGIEVLRPAGTIQEAARRIGKVEVDHGETGCKTPEAIGYIEKMWARKRAKKKT